MAHAACCGSKHFGDTGCLVLQSHKTEALAGKLSAVYGVMGSPDFIKQKQSHTAHKSQVGQHQLPVLKCCLCICLQPAMCPSTASLHQLRMACTQTGCCISLHLPMWRMVYSRS